MSFFSSLMDSVSLFQFCRCPMRRRTDFTAVIRSSRQGPSGPGGRTAWSRTKLRLSLISETIRETENFVDISFLDRLLLPASEVTSPRSITSGVAKQRNRFPVPVEAEAAPEEVAAESISPLRRRPVSKERESVSALSAGASPASSSSSEAATEGSSGSLCGTAASISPMERERGGAGRGLAGSSVHLVVLNMPLPANFPFLCDAASSIVCADGGANHMYDTYTSKEEWSGLMPSSICGDLDSIREDVLSFYESKGVKIQKNPDQESNDLEKCFEMLQRTIEKEEREVEKRILSSASSLPHASKCLKQHMVVVGAFGGRFDQTIANVHLLYKLLFSETQKNGFGENARAPSLGARDMVLLGEGSLGVLLAPGRTVLRLPQKCIRETCGLLPLGLECRSVRTEGLKWNLEGEPLSMGSRISSSNKFLGRGRGNAKDEGGGMSVNGEGNGDREVVIETSDPLLWYSQLLKELK
uniref:Thiamin pyrophosphokinase thiamin-binding domain-containing protein n=1 Tax=Chromera velia CCMP2878 TaxID=1169474 RepID=A0A0G4I4G2_9ALVE|eukprot:Cvel_10848.t1-p1 / transcript=Cvel_10848.t1 / gene=Cvel_10848 / organism=Chromera_velia_CCMP2878 / gene_product=Thiamin pyrophosphokinase 1, putative / transcript_product=Thiamin pyrophosphokinase 1, putative / location=Cvel_scaffold664:13424-16052(-) / protein_length=470 / sequence_SO=supercontig / SO=protein_coding / is_pseudo=false